MKWFESKLSIVDNFFIPVKYSVKIVSKGAKTWKSILQRQRSNTTINESYEKSKIISKSLTDFASDPQKWTERLKVNQQKNENNKDFSKMNRCKKNQTSDYDDFQYSTSMEERKIYRTGAFGSTGTLDEVENERKLEIIRGGFVTLEQEKFQAVSNNSNLKNTTDLEVLDLNKDSVNGKKLTSVPCNLHNEMKDRISQLGEERGTFIFDTDVSFLQNIYEPLDDQISPMDRHTCENIMKDRFIVGLSDTPTRRNSPMCTPICKSSNKQAPSTDFSGGSLPSKIHFNNTNLFENSFSTSAISCGSTEQLEISFSSSHGSEDSISELLSEDGEEERAVDESDIHFQTFDYLRRKRDEQFLMMKEITKQLKGLRLKNERKVVHEILQAERKLLFSTVSYRNYIFNMTNCNYSLEKGASDAIATITISQIMIPRKNTRRSRKDLCSYYVCIARSEGTILITNYIKPEGPDGAQYLLFDDVLEFENLCRSFSINVDIYEMNFVEKKQVLRREAMEKSFEVHHYNNLSSPTNEEKHILPPAFKQCAGFEISLKNIERSRIFNHFPDSVLSKTASITKHISSLKTHATKRGFLNFGQRHAQDDVIIWNLKYVSLEESELKIYNSPNDLEPLVKIDLKMISSELVSHSCHLKYCVQLDIVCEDSNFHFAFKYPYFLRANTSSDFGSWLEQLNYVISTLKQWNMLEYIN